MEPNQSQPHLTWGSSFDHLFLEYYDTFSSWTDFLFSLFKMEALFFVFFWNLMRQKRDIHWP